MGIESRTMPFSGPPPVNFRGKFTPVPNVTGVIKNPDTATFKPEMVRNMAVNVVCDDGVQREAIVFAKLDEAGQPYMEMLVGPNNDDLDFDPESLAALEDAPAQPVPQEMDEEVQALSRLAIGSFTGGEIVAGDKIIPVEPSNIAAFAAVEKTRHGRKRPVIEQVVLE